MIATVTVYRTPHDFLAAHGIVCADQVESFVGGSGPDRKGYVHCHTDQGPRVLFADRGGIRWAANAANAESVVPPYLLSDLRALAVAGVDGCIVADRLRDDGYEPDPAAARSLESQSRVYGRQPVYRTLVDAFAVAAVLGRE